MLALSSYTNASHTTGNVKTSTYSAPARMLCLPVTHEDIGQLDK